MKGLTLAFLSFATAFAQSSTTASVQTTPLTTLPSSSLITSTATGNFNFTSFAPTTAPISAVSTSPPIVPGEYRLRAQNPPGQPRHFWGLYLSGFSTIPDYSADAVLTNNKSSAAKFYLNGTFEQVDFGKGKQWYLSVPLNLNVYRWIPIGMFMRNYHPLSIQYGVFFINGTGLQWTPNQTPPPHNGSAAIADTYFGGWVACQWSLGLPSLFFKIGFFNDTVLPSTCANVNLVPEYF